MFCSKLIKLLLRQRLRKPAKQLQQQDSNPFSSFLYCVSALRTTTLVYNFLDAPSGLKKIWQLIFFAPFVAFEFRFTQFNEMRRPGIEPGQSPFSWMHCSRSSMDTSKSGAVSIGKVAYYRYTNGACTEYN